MSTSGRSSQSYRARPPFSSSGFLASLRLAAGTVWRLRGGYAASNRGGFTATLATTSSCGLRPQFASSKNVVSASKGSRERALPVVKNSSALPLVAWSEPPHYVRRKSSARTTDVGSKRDAPNVATAVRWATVDTTTAEAHPELLDQFARRRVESIDDLEQSAEEALRNIPTPNVELTLDEPRAIPAGDVRWTNWAGREPSVTAYRRTEADPF